MFVARENSRPRWRAAVVAALGGALIVPLLVGSSALGATNATLKVNPTVGHPQQSVTFTGTGYAANETVKIYFDAVTTTMVVQAKAGTQGGIGNVVATVPATATPGSHRFVAQGVNSHRTATAAFLVQTDWPQLGFGPQRTYANPYENVINAGNVNQLQRRWSRQEPAGLAVVGGGRLYGVEGMDYFVDAFDPATGLMKWHGIFDDEWTYSVPPYANGLVFVHTGDVGTLVALDARTGAQRWVVYTLLGGLLPDAQPIVANGIVYVFTDFSQTGSRTLYGLDAATGATRFSMAVPGFSKYDTFGIAAVSNSVAYVSVSDDYPGNPPLAFVAIDTTNGHQLWKSAPLDNVAVANGLVYGTSGKTLVARDARTGALRWSTTQQSATFGPLAVTGTDVYALTTGNGASRVHDYNALTGAQPWSAATGGTASTALSVANGVVYVGTKNGHLAAFDAKTGALRWNPVLTVTGPIEIVDGTVYFMSAYDWVEGTAMINAYQLPTG